MLTLKRFQALATATAAGAGESKEEVEGAGPPETWTANVNT